MRVYILFFRNIYLKTWLELVGEYTRCVLNKKKQRGRGKNLKMSTQNKKQKKLFGAVFFFVHIVG